MSGPTHSCFRRTAIDAFKFPLAYCVGHPKSWNLLSVTRKGKSLPTPKAGARPHEAYDRLR